MWSTVAWVATGGALGAVARFGVALSFGRTAFPWATLTVNVAGSLLIGFLGIWLSERFPLAVDLRAFLLIGLLGGFTTFSTFSWETVALLENGTFIKAGLNMLANLCACVIAAMLGMLLARQIV